MSKFTRNLMNQQARGNSLQAALDANATAQHEAARAATRARLRAMEYLPSLEGGATQTGSMRNPDYDPEHAKRYWAEQEALKAQEAQEASSRGDEDWPSLEG